MTGAIVREQKNDMLRLVLQVSLFAALGAAIGAAAIFFLADRLPEGAIMGALLGGSLGALIGARMDAWRSAKAFASEDPDAALRSAALLSTREGQIRAFHRDSSTSIGGMKPVSKIEDMAARGSQTGGAERHGHGESKR